MRGNRSTLRFESLETRRMLASNSVEVPVHVLSEVGTTRLDPPLSSGVSGLYSAKLNDDLFPDLIATSFGGLEVLYGDGQGSFEVHQHYDAITRGLGQIEFGDLNNDGRMDWIAHGEDLMRVFVSQADGDWEWTDLPIEPGISVALGRIDDDGIPDLVRHLGTGDIHVHVGKGDGTFKDSVAFAVNAPASGRTVVHRLIEDLNQDGFDDIVRRTQLLSSTSGTTTEVLLNDGSGHFEITLSTGVENSPYALVDLNGDGKLDLMTSDYRFHGGIFGESLNFTTHLGNGDGTFSDAKTIFSCQSNSRGSFLWRCKSRWQHRHRSLRHRGQSHSDSMGYEGHPWQRRWHVSKGILRASGNFRFGRVGCGRRRHGRVCRSSAARRFRAVFVRSDVR